MPPQACIAALVLFSRQRCGDKLHDVFLLYQRHEGRSPGQALSSNRSRRSSGGGGGGSSNNNSGSSRRRRRRRKLEGKGEAEGSGVELCVWLCISIYEHIFVGGCASGRA